jgi:hypothetical protein
MLPSEKPEVDDAVDVGVKKIWNFFAEGPLADELPGVECISIPDESAPPSQPVTPALTEVWDYYRTRLKRSLHLKLTKQRRDGAKLASRLAGGWL